MNRKKIKKLILRIAMIVIIEIMLIIAGAINQNLAIILTGIISITITAVIVVFIIKNIIKKDSQYEIQNNQLKKDTKQAVYQKKATYLTNAELEFYNVIKDIVGNNYIALPQIPLSQIINKTSNYKYQNELYRIIDIGIFTKDYTPLICIEINDNTHHNKQRYLRDLKVKKILHKANIPIITLWTEYGINRDYIKRRISKYIQI